MFYILFTYSKGHKEKDFLRFRSEDDVIEFLHKHYEKIDIVQIVSANKSFRLGLIETEDLIKSVLVRDKESLELKDLEERSDQDLKVELSGHGKPLPPIEEKTGMEKIADDIEKEQEEDESDLVKSEITEGGNILLGPQSGRRLTDEEIMKKNKVALKKADGAIAAAKKDLEKSTGFIPAPVVKSIKRHYTQNEDRKKDWRKCPDCNRRKIAPWNKSGRCSKCQQYKKIPKKKTVDLPF